MRLLLVALYAIACYLWLQTDLSAGATIFIQDQLDELTALSRALKKYRSIQPRNKQFLDDLIADRKYHKMLRYLLVAAEVARTLRSGQAGVETVEAGVEAGGDTSMGNE